MDCITIWMFLGNVSVLIVSLSVKLALGGKLCGVWRCLGQFVPSFVDNFGIEQKWALELEQHKMHSWSALWVCK